MPQYMLSSAYDQANIVPVIGMLGRPLGHSYPDLVTQLLAMYQDHLSGIDWLPLGWWDSVNGLMPGAEGAVLIPAGAGTSLAPTWLDTPDKVAFWTDFSTLSNDAVATFLANWKAAGQADLDAATATADFWDEAYNITSVVASPVTIVEDVAKGAASAAATAGSVINAMGSFSTPIILGGIGLVAYFVFFHHPTVRLATNPPRRRSRRR